MSFLVSILGQHFADVPDPRCRRVHRHSLVEILTLALCALLCGADTFKDMERFARAKQAWFREHLGLVLRHGVPSHDTFGRVFARLDAKAFAACLLAWTKALAQETQGEVIALDGKTLRHSFDTATGQAAVHLVSAWAATNRLVLTQRRVESKENEIVALPELLALLDIVGCTVTIDAIGTQKAIASQIVAQGGDYILPLKDNHRRLHQEVRRLFDWVDSGQGAAEEVHLQEAVSVHYGHGRQERRRCTATNDLDWLDETDDSKSWIGLHSVARLESERRLGDKVSREVRYFLCSFPADAKRVLQTVRAHWGIENRLHWTLDVAFREDECRVRRNHAPENLATLRKIALNLLKRETSEKAGIKAKRLKAGWDEQYLLRVLMQTG